MMIKHFMFLLHLNCAKTGWLFYNFDIVRHEFFKKKYLYRIHTEYLLKSLVISVSYL